MQEHLNIDAQTVRRLRRLCEESRSDVIETLGYVGSGHSGPSLSIIEVLVTLYFHEMRVDAEKPKWEDRDRFVLSKGHGALGFYAVLSRRGYFPRDELFTFESLGSRLQGHPDTLLTPGVELSTGSLGQGLSFAAGVAIAARMQDKATRAYCLLGDGETEEGNVWEAAMSAAKFKLDNLLAIVDWNGLQGGVTLEVMPSLEPYVDKWLAFGWHVIDIPGHDIPALLNAYHEARHTTGKPTVIIARTVKGKGVSFMENDPNWHAGVLKGEQLEQARREVAERLEQLK
ncbi:MAG: transketolase [Anaerolineae bacterium]|nr:transketolase [Anaerolineae bacterium]